MRTLSALSAASMLAATACGMPSVTVTGWERDAASGRLTTTYTLTEPAVVTLDVQTNSPSGWVSIGRERITRVTGDVNKLVDDTASPHTVSWMPGGETAAFDLPADAVRLAVRAWSTNAPPDILVLNLLNGKTAYYEDVRQVPGGIGADIYRTDCLVMRKIPAKGVTWRMGGTTSRLVTLTNDYYMGVFEMTQAQAMRITGWTNVQNYSSFTNGFMRPVDCMHLPSWAESSRALRYPFKWPDADWETARTVVSYCFIGKMRTLTGWGLNLDLPTEAQWEYAARAGTAAELPDGSSLSVRTGGEDAGLSRYARYRYNGGYADGGATRPGRGCTTENATARVGSYEPNAWGLYDMLGNVSEWCLDRYGVLDETPVTNPVGATSGNMVIRGGSWASEPSACTLKARASYNHWIEDASLANDIGFRVCLTL